MSEPLENAPEIKPESHIIDREDAWLAAQASSAFYREHHKYDEEDDVRQWFFLVRDAVQQGHELEFRHTPITGRLSVTTPDGRSADFRIQNYRIKPKQSPHGR